MYLKRLESVGFKSFAERINVDFVPGVTAVVGPNGSGKSNITDAIRWVLGEQSARSLRGSKMEDIIFQGSDSRKPLNVAEVSLVLDNSDKKLPLDYEEVNVTRRVYRSGESEFYINKQPCRLKDIVDLFMDSGLGREAFSIISQGKVEEILSSKAEERRTIFEEAAGVLKYKQRKKKAEYKLAETQENLNRVEDIIHEIEQQIGPLEEQAETAQIYLERKKQLKEQEIALLVTEIEQLHNKWQQLLEALENDKMKEINQQTLVQQKEATLASERQQMQALDEEIERLQNELLHITQGLEQLEGKKHVLNERTKHFAENKEKLELQKSETAEKVTQYETELKEEKEKLRSLETEQQKTKQHLEQLENKLAHKQENIAEHIETLKADYIEYLNKQAAKRNEKQTIQQQLQQLNGKETKQKEKFEDVLTEREVLTKKLSELKTAFDEQKKAYTGKETEFTEMKESLDQERSLFQENQTKLYQGYQYIEKLKSKKEMLEEMKEDFQGFFHGVKAVLKANKQNELDQIHGAVIELIDVSRAYVTAIETVLGSQAQHIVVEHDASAREAISWLKKTNNGRATFLPLSSIQPRFIPKDILGKVEKYDGFIGVASQLISIPKAYQKVADHLMGHVIVAKTLKDANEIAKLVMRRFRIVTLEGDVVNPGGSMSGGAQKKTNQSLFTREKDLEEITKKLDEFTKKAKNFEEKVTNQKGYIQQTEETLKKMEKDLSSERAALQETHNELKEKEMKLSSLQDNLVLYDQDKQQFDEDRTILIQREKELDHKLATIKEQLTTLQDEIDRLTKEEETVKENQEQLQAELHRYQVTLAEQDERAKSQREKTKSVETQLNEIEKQYDQYTRDLQDLIAAHESNDTVEEMHESIIAKKEAKESLTTKIQEKRTERTNKTKWVEDEERELKEENKNHQAIQKEIQEKEVKANRLDVALETRLSHLQEEYMITFEKAKADYDKVDNLDTAKEKVSQIKQSIDNLGTVNLGAIDEYERISERYTFLSEQRTDLVDAKETLYSVIAEMDEEMQKRFDHTFSSIKEEFAIVFRELFGGGQAELTLTDPNNLLETGVEIVAQPPGKKLQHLGLLSGGERALTAIALLFSILRVRPVPFCVLDEVEAALDEANVSRFAKYIKQFSEDTQFIVITHRKGTMEEANVLYGVTMQESGVSRLVSVRLEDTKELVKS
ncbi:chromosome segregation protein SMC [Oceanobacillus halotolerans]|uniref:chromosome segregation protein SMC n=1 Tax=Oceanobacillus halotolerans TaxID=2663380 RepID=UPI0013DBFA5F|nr:chromosome segregation protein SMC [Oceanobacillus halotolerans]